MQALAAPRYRLTLVARAVGSKTFCYGNGKGAAGEHRFYTAEEVQRLMDEGDRRRHVGGGHSHILQDDSLTGLNERRQFDVYITPEDPEFHYLLIDDMKPGAARLLSSEGYAPCLVLKSSEGNEQAVLKVPRDGGRSHGEEQKAANRIVQQLNGWAGDPRLSGAKHAFRLAGFRNMKQGRNRATVELLVACRCCCDKATLMLNEARALISSKSAPRGNAKTPALVRNEPLHALSRDALRDFQTARRRVEQFVALKGWRADDSAIDFRAAQSVLKAGWSPKAVGDAMLLGSPSLGRTRHTSSTLSYVQTTVLAALAQLERSKVSRVERNRTPGQN